MSRLSKIDFIVDAMRDADWPQVQAIYEEGIATGNATFETNAPTWEEWDADHLKVGRLVARQGDRVIGWTALSPVSKRAVYKGVAEVSTYVAADSRGRGVGKALRRRLIEEADRAGIWTLQAMIFPENQASIAFNKRFGFRIVGRRERLGQMNGVWRDVILMERRAF